MKVTQSRHTGSKSAAKIAPTPAAGSGHRGLGKPSSNARPTGAVKSPTVGKHSVTTRSQPTNRTPGKAGSASNW
jgi:hypothetical protein